MAQEHMTCRRCPLYDKTAMRCRDGKTNPRRKADAFTVAEMFGARALCFHNRYREALAFRMYYPAQAAVPIKAGTISVEVMPEEAES